MAYLGLSPGTQRQSRRGSPDDLRCSTDRKM
uniref:Uncharacterized protein n=1 Tax=Rhizophora mucronata TaxID=61149 RepID=A0A2P2NZX4_RHIMU